MDQEYEARFSGIGRLYGVDAMVKLSQAHVCVVGVGGVGSWTVEALARSGVGALTLIDMDDVCVSNTNRQLPALTDNVGVQKVDVLARRIQGIHPGCEVRAVSDFFTASTADALLDAPYDVVIDAIDDLKNKVLLISECVARGVGIVTVGGAGGRRDPSQITHDDLSRSGRDGLLRRVRQKLRKEHGFGEGPWGVPCVFSQERQTYPTPDGDIALSRPEGMNLKLDCASGFGTATFVTGTYGFVAAGLAIDLLLGS